MKYEEAIHKLKPLTITLSQISDCSEMYHALTLAIDALERQIPKHVIMRDCCPNCAARAITETGDPYIDYELIYCNNCGQHLDWSK